MARPLLKKLPKVSADEQARLNALVAGNSCERLTRNATNERPSLLEQHLKLQGQEGDRIFLAGGRVYGEREAKNLRSIPPPSRERGKTPLERSQMTEFRPTLRKLFEDTMAAYMTETGKNPLMELLVDNRTEFFRILGNLQPKDVNVQQMVKQVVVVLTTGAPPPGWVPPEVGLDDPATAAAIAKQAMLEAECACLDEGEGAEGAEDAERAVG